MNDIKINENIALFRREKGVTQEELAVVLGVTNQAVSKWESGQCCPNIGLLPKLAGYFGVSIDTLMGYEAPQKSIALQNTSDPLLERAIKIAEESGRVSASVLQRTLCIGYGKAKSIIDAMAEGGYIVKDDTKRYDVYVWTGR